ncbi:MAG TPA: tetratricopeptide repeat protein [Terriglobia bacterium]|nr:tetratricopeptide repeat protein [Terriglobia bacterium]
MTSQRIQIFVASLCLFALGAQGWASGHAAGSPCPAQPAISGDLAAGKYAEAVSVLQQQVSRNPRDAQATLWLARSFLDLGQNDQAVTFAERAVSLSPDCSESHFWLARSYGLKADKERSFWLARKTRQEYETAVQLDPDNLAARRDLMEFYLQAPWILGGSKEKAWDQIKAIASRNAAEGDLARAIYWRDLNEPSLAAKEYRKVMESKPAHAEAYFQVADFYEADRKPEEVEAAVRAASRIVPRDPRLDYYEAVANAMKGQALVKAERDLKTYLLKAPPRDDFPPHASAHDWLGHIYELRGETRQAVEQYRFALRLSPDNRTAHDALLRLDAN